MNRCKFGVKLECFGVPLRKALLLAAQAGAQGVQFDVTGELSPDKLSESGRREISYLLRSYNLQLASIFCPLSNGLDVALDQEQRILHLKKSWISGLILALACLPFMQVRSPKKR